VRTRVLAEVDVLDRHRVWRVLVDQRTHPLMDVRQPSAGVLPRGGFDHPAVERHEPAAMVRDDAVARVGHARIDAEDDHVHDRDSARRAGRLPAVPVTPANGNGAG